MSIPIFNQVVNLNALGTPTAPTAVVGTNTNQIATTAFVASGLSLKADSDDVTSGLALKAPLVEPTFTGPVTVTGDEIVSGNLQVDGQVRMSGNVNFDKNVNVNGGINVEGGLNIEGIPTAPTAVVGTNTTQLATTAFVNTSIDVSQQNYVIGNIDVTQFFKVYDNLRNSFGSQVDQPFFSDDDSNKPEIIFYSQKDNVVHYKMAKVTTADILANQFFAFCKIIYSLIGIPQANANMVTKISDIISFSDLVGTKIRCKEVWQRILYYSDELIAGTTFAPLSLKMKSYASTIGLLAKAFITICNDQSTMSPTLDEGFINFYNPSDCKFLMNSLGAGVNETMHPSPPFYYSVISGKNVKLSVDASFDLPNKYKINALFSKQYLQCIRNIRSEIPEFGVPPVVWGPTEYDSYLTTTPEMVTNILSYTFANGNDDGMGYSLPEELDYYVQNVGTITLATGYDSLSLNSCYFPDKTFEGYSLNHPYYKGKDDAGYVMSSLSDQLTLDQKQDIYNKCKKIVEKEWIPTMDEIYQEQYTSIITNGVRYYDKDLWNANWRWLVPGKIIGPTQQDSNGFYQAYTVDVTDISQSTINKMTSELDSSGTPLASVTNGIMTISIKHSNIKRMSDYYTAGVQSVMAIFPGDKFGKTIKIDSSKNYSNYDSYLSILENYGTNIITTTDAESITDLIHQNGLETQKLHTDLKFKNADDWIKHEKYINSDLFDGADDLASYTGATLDEKYINVCNVASSTKSELMKCDLEVLGYNYGFLPEGYTGADSDIAPVFVYPGFTPPTIGQLKAQQDLTKVLYDTSGNVLVDLQVVYDVTLPFLFIYRQHYTIARTNGTTTGANGSTPSGTPYIPGTPLRISVVNGAVTISRLDQISTRTTVNPKCSQMQRLSSPTDLEFRRITYLGYKAEDAFTKLTKLYWNEADIRKNYFSDNFINTYLLEPGQAGSREIKNKIRLVLIESAGGSGWGAAGNELSPNEQEIWVFAYFSNSDPYFGGGAVVPNNNVQIAAHEGTFGHQLQGIKLLTDTMNNLERTTPWMSEGLGDEFYKVGTTTIFSGPNYEGVAVYGETVSLCLGYRAKISLTNEVTLDNNYAVYVGGLNDLSRVSTRQVVDTAYNLPKYGYSTARLINGYMKGMHGSFIDVAGFVVRTMARPVQQLVYNTGFTTNNTCANLIKRLITENSQNTFDFRKFIDFRLSNTYLFVDLDLAIEYFTSNYMNFIQQI